MNIGLLEDDRLQAELVCGWLQAAGHTVAHQTLGRDFIAACNNEAFDIAILDWELPDQTGIDVLLSLRSKHQNTVPVLFATQRDAEQDIVTALNAGADDYLVKPLRHRELMARLEAMKRRAGIIAPEDVITLGAIQIDTHDKSIVVDGKPVKVTQKDYDLAVFLCSNMGKVLSRDHLLKMVWGVDSSLNTRTVDVHISRLRRMLNITPDRGYCIKTIYQHGYRLEKVVSPATGKSV